jgi:uncharacterized membrane protein YfhO
MFMREFFTDLITLLFFAVALGLFWAAVTVVYPTVFINLVLVIISIFVLLQGCERLDKAYNLGPYQEKEEETEEEQNHDEM